MLAETHDRLGELLLGAARSQEAEQNFDLARTYKIQLAKDCPDVPGFHGELAWFLAQCPDERFRDPARAIASATTACDLAPLDGNQWVRLGAARYRSGDWRGAIAALEKAKERGNGLTPADWLFQAMSRWRAGDKRKAEQCYGLASLRLQKQRPTDEELRRLFAEAKALIPDNSAGPVGAHESLN